MTCRSRWILENARDKSATRLHICPRGYDAIADHPLGKAPQLARPGETRGGVAWANGMKSNA